MSVFEWDEAKNASNLAEHGILFERAVQIFDGWVLTETDNRFDYGEVRQKSLGLMEGRVVLAVIHTDRYGHARIISARPANRLERKLYEATLHARIDP